MSRSENPARDLVLGIDGPRTPRRGDRIEVVLDPEGGDEVSVPGVLIEAGAAGLWWAPEYAPADTCELSPWHRIRYVAADFTDGRA